MTGVLGCGGWEELEEGEASGLKPETRAGVLRERFLSLEGEPGDLEGGWVVREGKLRELNRG